MDAIATDWDGKGSRCAKAEDLQRDGPSALACCLNAFSATGSHSTCNGNIELFKGIPSTSGILLSLLNIITFHSP